jgi:hypothetical protein
VIVINADAKATHQSVVDIMQAAQVGRVSPYFLRNAIAALRRSESVMVGGLKASACLACGTGNRLAPVLWPLLPLSWLFRLLVGVRRWLVSLWMLPSFCLPVPVIVVGNLTVGGSGKTPLVLWLAARLRNSGGARNHQSGLRR